MTWQRSTYLDEIRHAADAYLSTRWSATTVSLLAGAVHLEEWRRLLNVQPALRKATLSLTRDTNGRVPWSSLTTGSGNTVQTAYRILDVRAGVTHYRHEPYALSPRATDSANPAGAGYIYRREADEVIIAPISALAAITVDVCHLPCAMNALAADSDTVVWPDAFEHVLVFATAARMLMKGGAETDASKDLGGIAKTLRLDMASAVGREFAGAREMRFGDDPASWGSR